MPGLRPCAEPRCPVQVMKGYCATHARQHDQRENADVRKWYQTPRWHALRDQVRREQPYCDDCLSEGRHVPWTDLDHTVPHRGLASLFWDRGNLRGKCKPHHSRKTGRGE